ncbi:hypothetical protein [Bradyrhizobium algeriense]|uniref:hypothetical protein n=1 Tax=Bradyrhizobium algeriense TaxID=634784 RepID=UPI0011AE3943|nr:hypothetical protein [Bradyrhizobium algeriense]
MITRSLIGAYRYCHTLAGGTPILALGPNLSLWARRLAAVTAAIGVISLAVLFRWKVSNPTLIAATASFCLNRMDRLAERTRLFNLK